MNHAPRMRWRSRTTLLVSLLICSCGHEPRGAVIGDHATRGEILIRGEKFIIYPQTIAVAGDYLVVGDRADTLVRLFDRHDGRHIASVGRKGSGPGEFQAVWSIQGRRTASGETWIWLYDIGLNRLTGYSLTAEGPSPVRYSVQSRLPGKAMSMQWLNDSVLVAVGVFEQARFYLSDLSGDPRGAFGKIPLASERFPALAAQQALQPRLAVRPDGGAIAVAARYAARVDIYDMPGGDLIPAQVPVPFDPLVNLRTGGAMPIFVSDGDTRFGYVAVTGNKHGIYALFSGRTRAQYPGRANFGDQVHLFDWNGHFVAALALEQDAIDIAVDDSGTDLYALSLDPEPAILKYRAKDAP
jgi:hypothetical protein